MSASKRTARQQSLIESKAKKPCRLTFESFCEAKAEELSNLFELCLDGLGLDEKKRSFEEFCGWAFDQATGIEIVSDSDDDDDDEEDSESEEIESEETETETETEELDSDLLESDDPSELDEESDSDPNPGEDDEDEDGEEESGDQEVEEEVAVENQE